MELKVELLLVLNKDAKIMANVEAASKSFYMIKNAKQLEENKIQYKGEVIEWFIEKVDNKSLIYDVSFKCNLKSKNVNVFEEYIGLYREFVKTLHDILRIETIWNDIGSYYANKCYPIINTIENKMRLLISKFMYFQEEYDWSSTHVSEKLIKNVRQTNADMSLIYSLDFIMLTDILFNEYPIKKFAPNQKEFSENDSNIDYNMIEPYIPKSNWKRYFEEYVGDGKNLQKLWEEIYKIRCTVAHNREVTSKEYQILSSKIQKIDVILQNLLDKIPDIKMTCEQIRLSEIQVNLDVITSQQYNKIMLLDYSEEEKLLKEYHNGFYEHMCECRQMFKEAGYSTGPMFTERQVLANQAFEVFKKNDSTTYFRIGVLRGNYNEYEGKEYYSFWNCDGSVNVAKCDDSRYDILIEAIVDRYNIC